MVRDLVSIDPQGLGLSDVMELPPRKPGANFTPPRHHALLEETAFALATPAAPGSGGPMSPGATLALKSSGDSRALPRMRSSSGTASSKWSTGPGTR